MEATDTITINEKEYALRKWPALPGFKYSRALTRLIADAYAGLTIKMADMRKIVSGMNSESEFKVDPNMVDRVFSDANFAAFLDMICDGIERASAPEFNEKERKELRAIVGKISFEEFCAALVVVIKHNVSFLTGHVTALYAEMMKLSATTTPLQVESPASVAVQSTPS